MSKTNRYNTFDNLPCTYRYQYGDPVLDMGIDTQRPLVVELGCGSGAYIRSLAIEHPDRQYLGVDIKSDRLHFGANYCAQHHINNVKRLCASVDHLSCCLLADSIDECWITFPDPRPTRDRQKLTSPKYQAIYKQLLKPGGIIHIKTDDEAFLDYSIQSLQTGGYIIRTLIRDIYRQSQQKLPKELMIQTYYEAQWLAQGRQVHYLQVQLDTH